MYTIEILDTASPKVEELLSLLDGPNRNLLSDAAGGSAAAQLRAHFNARNNTPNRLGGERTNYWASVADSTAHQVTDDGFLLFVDHLGVTLHYEGGEIRPVNAKFLTIPASAEAHGKKAREFPDLVPIFFDKGTADTKSFGALIRPHDDDTFDVIFWLAKRAKITADKTVLPTEPELVNAALDGARDALDRVTQE